MTMLRDILVELFDMFVGDAPLTIANLIVVALSAVLIDLAPVNPLIGGAVLLVGCLVVLIENVRRSSATS